VKKALPKKAAPKMVAAVEPVQPVIAAAAVVEDAVPAGIDPAVYA